MIKKRKILSLGYREMPVDMQNIIMSATLPDSAFEDKNPKPFTIKIDPKDEHRNSIKTLYGGLFEEVYAKKEIEPYGHFTFNTATNTISAFDVHNSNDFIIDPVAFAYDFGARMYDPRLGIFISADPHESRYPMWSPYSAMAGNPINIIDPTGMSGEPVIDKKNQTITVTSNIVFYGSDGSKELAEKSAANIQSQWNAAGGKTTIDGVEYSVKFSVTGTYNSSITADDINPLCI